MKKLFSLLIALALVLTLAVGISAATSYGSSQVKPDTDSPNMVYAEFHTKEAYGKNRPVLTVGFDNYDPFIEPKWLGSADLIYKVRHITINNKKIYVDVAPGIYWDGSEEVGDTYFYQPGKKKSGGGLSYPENDNAVSYVYEFYFDDDSFPSPINNKWYINEISFDNSDYDALDGSSIKYPTYEFTHAALESRPVIELNGGDIVKHNIPYTFVEPGFTARTSILIDGEYTDLTDSVVVEYGSLTPGTEVTEDQTYFISYTVTNDSGKSTTVFRTVMIGDDAPEPVIVKEPESTDDAYHETGKGLDDITKSSILSDQSLSDIILEYWWIIVILTYGLGLIFTKRQTAAFGMAIVVLVIMWMAYGDALFSDSLNALKTSLTETNNSTG